MRRSRIMIGALVIAVLLLVATIGAIVSVLGAGSRVTTVMPPTATVMPPTATVMPPTATAGAGTTVHTDRTGAEYVAVPAGAGIAAFRIMRTEVTNAQYAQCVGAGACDVPVMSTHFIDTSRTDHPVVGTSRAQAREYAVWIGGRLLGQAQWLRACQGDDDRTYPWGEQPADPSRGQFNRTYFNSDYTISEDYRTAPAGAFPAGASAYGALDMAGNV